MQIVCSQPVTFTGSAMQSAVPWQVKHKG
jgi:hypothetical protein